MDRTGIEDWSKSLVEAERSTAAYLERRAALVAPSADERIASALERIADALERQQSERELPRSSHEPNSSRAGPIQSQT